MKPLNEMVCLLNLEGSCLTFPLNFVTGHVGFLPDVLVCLYPRLRSALTTFYSGSNFHFSSIFYTLRNAGGNPFNYKHISLHPPECRQLILPHSIFLRVERWNKQASFFSFQCDFQTPFLPIIFIKKKNGYFVGHVI